MKELMDEIERRFFKELDKDTISTNDDVKNLYNKVSKEVYLEKLAQMMDRN